MENILSKQEQDTKPHASEREAMVVGMVVQKHNDREKLKQI